MADHLFAVVGDSEWDGYISWGVMSHDSQKMYVHNIYPWGHYPTLAPEAYGRFYYTRLYWREPGTIVFTNAWWKGARMVDLWYYNG